MTIKLPHPIPYQGSKRKLAPFINSVLPTNIDTFYEPFAGSAAMSLYASYHNLAKHYVIGDSLESIIDLWSAIVNKPEETSLQYESIWKGQKESDPDYFKIVRERYNAFHDPIDLLYLICRCVKNAVRFNANGNFTQSADKRRLGMRPDNMRRAIAGASSILRGKVEFRKGDWLTTTSDAKPSDFVYMDPPYLGTSIGRDKRYHQQLELEHLIAGLIILNEKNIRFALSYDGKTGNKEYGSPLPKNLNMAQLSINAGRSSQSTLQGKNEITIESLYLSGNLKPPKIRVLG